MKKLLSIYLLLTLVSCSTAPETKTENPFNAVTLKEKLIEGKTTQAQVLETFGAPEITTTDESEEEIWTYAKHSYQNERNSFGVDALGLLIPSPLDFMWVDASTSKSESSTKTLSVTIRFDKNKIVRSYKISQSRV